jgi:hypothetical protein
MNRQTTPDLLRPNRQSQPFFSSIFGASAVLKYQNENLNPGDDFQRVGMEILKDIKISKIDFL